MRIEHLEKFVDLSCSLNFTQTANRFFIVQPTLSHHISGLEHEPDARLLYGDRFYAVVPAGHRLASYKEVGPEDLKGEDVVVPSHRFWQENTEGIRSYLHPVTDDIRVRSVLQDINSLPLFIKTQECIGIAMSHLKNYYRDDLVFIPLAGCALRFPVGVAWRRSSADEVLHDYLDCVERAMKGGGAR